MTARHARRSLASHHLRVWAPRVVTVVAGAVAVWLVTDAAGFGAALPVLGLVVMAWYLDGGSGQ